jgi:hypothetical protein
MLLQILCRKLSLIIPWIFKHVQNNRGTTSVIALLSIQPSLSFIEASNHRSHFISDLATLLDD